MIAIAKLCVFLTLCIQYNTAQNTGTCTLLPSAKVDCGWRGIRGPTCVAIGCCYEQSNQRGIPWCFYKQDTPIEEQIPKLSPLDANLMQHGAPQCRTVQYTRRERCGSPNQSQIGCESRGCCYDTSQTNYYWCFYPLDYFNVDGKDVTTFTGVSYLSQLWVDSIFTSIQSLMTSQLWLGRIEYQILLGMRYNVPYVETVTVTDIDNTLAISYNITVISPINTNITTTSLVNSFSSAIARKNLRVFNYKMFMDTPPNITESVTCVDSCHPLAACKGMECQCIVGYEGDGMTSCVDIDECSNPQPNCTSCVNTQGSYNCGCDSGYILNNGVCDDINECTDNNHTCGGLSTCLNQPGWYSCLCPSGYDLVLDAGEYLCEDINDCMQGLNKCEDPSECVNVPGSYACVCPLGFIQDTMTSPCIDIDECDVTNGTLCANNADCVNTMGSFMCDCGVGFEGNGLNGCEDIDECTNTGVCEEYSTCNNTYGSYICGCGVGFYKVEEDCVDLEECEEGLHNCSGNTSCINTAGSFICWCPYGYNMDGSSCTNNQSESTTCDPLFGEQWNESAVLCHDDAECVYDIIEMAYTCKCEDGYIGNGSWCADDDECSNNMHACHVYAECENEEGDYDCECMDGYKGDGYTCEDINECEAMMEICPPNTKCRNLVGNYSCSCVGGYVEVGGGCQAQLLMRGTILLDPAFTYTQSLANPDSPEFQDLALSLEIKLAELYDVIQGIVTKVAVVGFMNGSVVVDHVISIIGETNITLDQFNASMNAAISDGRTDFVSKGFLELETMEPEDVRSLLTKNKSLEIIPRVMGDYKVEYMEKRFKSYTIINPNVIRWYSEKYNDTLNITESAAMELYSKLERDLYNGYSYRFSYVDDVTVHSVTSLNQHMVDLNEVNMSSNRSSRYVYEGMVELKPNVGFASLTAMEYKSFVISVQGRLRGGYMFALKRLREAGKSGEEGMKIKEKKGEEEDDDDEYEKKKENQNKEGDNTRKKEEEEKRSEEKGKKEDGEDMFNVFVQVLSIELKNQYMAVNSTLLVHHIVLVDVPRLEPTCKLNATNMNASYNVGNNTGCSKLNDSDLQMRKFNPSVLVLSFATWYLRNDNMFNSVPVFTPLSLPPPVESIMIPGPSDDDVIDLSMPLLVAEHTVEILGPEKYLESIDGGKLSQNLQEYVATNQSMNVGYIDTPVYIRIVDSYEMSEENEEPEEMYEKFEYKAHVLVSVIPSANTVEEFNLGKLGYKVLVQTFIANVKKVYEELFPDDYPTVKVDQPYTVVGKVSAMVGKVRRPTQDEMLMMNMTGVGYNMSLVVEHKVKLAGVGLVGWTAGNISSVFNKAVMVTPFVGLKVDSDLWNISVELAEKNEDFYEEDWMMCHLTKGAVLNFTMEAQDAVSCGELHICYEGVYNSSVYGCQCKYGYVGNGSFCYDENECETDTHSCHVYAECENEEGDYDCECKDGYKGDGYTCEDINECDDNTCPPNATCINTMGGYKCLCGEVGGEVNCTGNMIKTSYFYGMIQLNSTFKFNNNLMNTSSTDFTDMAQFIGEELSTYFGQNTGFNMTATVFEFINGSELMTAQYVVNIEGQGHKVVTTGMLLSSFFASMSMRNLSRDGFTFGGFPFKLKRISWEDVRILLPKNDSYDKDEDVFKIKLSSYIQLDTTLSQKYNKLEGNIFKEDSPAFKELAGKLERDLFKTYLFKIPMVEDIEVEEIVPEADITLDLNDSGLFNSSRALVFKGKVFLSGNVSLGSISEVDMIKLRTSVESELGRAFMPVFQIKGVNNTVGRSEKEEGRNGSYNIGNSTYMYMRGGYVGGDDIISVSVTEIREATVLERRYPENMVSSNITAEYVVVILLPKTPPQCKGMKYGKMDMKRECNERMNLIWNLRNLNATNLTESFKISSVLGAFNHDGVFRGFPYDVMKVTSPMPRKVYLKKAAKIGSSTMGGPLMVSYNVYLSSKVMPGVVVNEAYMVAKFLEAITDPALNVSTFAFKRFPVGITIKKSSYRAVYNNSNWSINTTSLELDVWTQLLSMLAKYNVTMPPSITSAAQIPTSVSSVLELDRALTTLVNLHGLELPDAIDSVLNIYELPQPTKSILSAILSTPGQLEVFGMKPSVVEIVRTALFF
ncbi:uncharacterized protein LOC100183596 [Ciona intestinalis]